MDMNGRQDIRTDLVVDATEIVTKALRGLDADNDRLDQQLIGTVAPKLALLAMATELGAGEGRDVDPAEVVWRTVAARAELQRLDWQRSTDPERHRTWELLAAAFAACLRDVGDPVGCAGLPKPDLSPLAAESDSPAAAVITPGQPPSVAATLPTRRPTQPNVLFGVVAALFGAAVGFVLWPVAAAIAGLGPSSPYSFGLDPISVFEQWWIMLLCTASGAYAGYIVGSGIGRRR